MEFSLKELKFVKISYFFDKRDISQEKKKRTFLISKI